MATTIKGGSFGKEKKGTSPSSTPLLKKSPKHSSSFATSSSSSSTKDKTPSFANEKPVPNYLKPTMASSLDFSRLPKKSATDSTFQKPVLNRRKSSFERPPSASSQGNKSLRNVAPSGSETKHIRSSSFISHKPGPALDRMYARTSSSSTLRESKVGPTLDRSRNLKKTSVSTSSSTATSKKGANNVDTKKESKSMISEPRIDDDHSIAGLEGDFVGNDYEVQSLPEISEMLDSNQELGDPAIPITDIEVRHVRNGKEIQDKSKSEDVDRIEERDLRMENITHDHESDKKRDNTVETKPEPETTKEKVSDQAEVNLAEQIPGGVDNVDNEVPSVSNVQQTEKLSGEKKEELVLEHNDFENGGQEVDLKDEIPSVSSPSEADVTVGIGHKTQSSKETLSSQSSPNNQKSDIARTTAQKVEGKKEKQEYNDVIEETASKLRGKKNKVLALAGAFETVISLERSKKK